MHSTETYVGIVSCLDLYSPAAKNGLGTIEQTARPLRGVTVMTYSVINCWRPRGNYIVRRTVRKTDVCTCTMEGSTLLCVVCGIHLPQSSKRRTLYPLVAANEEAHRFFLQFVADAPCGQVFGDGSRPEYACCS